MFADLRPVYDFTLYYTHKLVADVPDQAMCNQPVDGRTMNHAAYVLGHLAWSNSFALQHLRRPKVTPPEWEPLFATDVQVLNVRSLYPGKQELLQKLDESHERLWEAANAAPPRVLAARPRGMDAFPTVGHMIVGVMTTHFGNHAGQLSAWRRALGYKPVFSSSLFFNDDSKVMFAPVASTTFVSAKGLKGLSGGR